LSIYNSILSKKWDFLYYQVKTVAEYFKRGPAVISREIRKVEKKRREEKAFDSRVSRVEEAIKEDKKRKIVNNHALYDPLYMFCSIVLKDQRADKGRRQRPLPLGTASCFF